MKRLDEELARERYGRMGELLYILNIYRSSDDSFNAGDNSSTSMQGLSICMSQRTTTLDHTHNIGLSIKGRVEIALYSNSLRMKHLILDNLVVASCKQVIADILAEKGIEIAYLAVGSGNTQQVSDTSLEQEIARKLITMRSASMNQVKFDTFIDTLEMVEIWREIGLLSSDYRLVARALISPEINKDNNNTATISWSITIA